MGGRDARGGDHAVLGRNDGGSGGARHTHEISEALVFIERGQADIRSYLFHRDQNTEIEGLDDHAGAQIVAIDRSQYTLREVARRGVEFGAVHFDFDVEPEVAAAGERQNPIQRGHTRSGNRFLPGKLGIHEGTAIPFLELGEGQVADEGTVARSLADARFEDGIVADNGNVVLCEVYIHLNSVDALIDGVFERGDGVFGENGTCASMAVDQYPGRHLMERSVT